MEFNNWLEKGFFARHETFCPRYGWLKKGYDRVTGGNGFNPDPKIFNAPDAIERLGVGKNMVRSIRYWCLAFKILGPDNEDNRLSLSGSLRGTEFGDALFENKGWDPFLEDIGSLWLLHWKLFTPPFFATAWSMAMNIGTAGPFSINDLVQSINERRDKIDKLKRYSESSIEKDASCFIRMYGPPSKGISDEIECPFTHLELLLSGDKKQTFRFNLKNKSTLPDYILIAACFEYAHHFHPHSNTVSLNRLVYSPNSPGIIFKLSESEIGNRLEKMVSEFNGVEFTESYGNRQLHFEIEPLKFCWDALEKYYQYKVRSRF